jgi:hypothetical protein
MTARIIHVGPDPQYRVRILENAGYFVDICDSIEAVHSSLVKIPLADAVTVTDSMPELSLRVATMVRATRTIPLIYFQGHSDSEDEFGFDLTIPRFTPPQNWIVEIEKFITEGRALRMSLKASCEESVLLRQDAAFLRSESAAARNRSRQLRQKIDDSLKRNGSRQD